VRKTWGYLAAGWAVLFAAVHLYWGLGGKTGLDVSAGPLAQNRPVLFVAVGLFGVAAALLVGAVIAVLLARLDVPPKLLLVIGAAVAWLLLVRGIGLTILMATGVVHAGDGITDGQLNWSYLLWNPWFILGGLCFLLAWRRARTARPVREGTP